MTTAFARRFEAGGLLHGISWSFALRLIDVGLAWVLSVMLARFLGVEQFGLYSFALSVVGLLALPVNFGVQPLIVRETGSAMADGEPDRIFALKRWAYTRVMAISLPIAITAAIVILFVPSLTDPFERSILLAGLALIVVQPFAEIRSALLRGMNHIAKSQLASSIVRPGVMLPLVGVLIAGWAYGFRPGVEAGVAAMALNVVAAILAWAVGAALLARVLRGWTRPESPQKLDISGWRSSMLSFGLANGMYVFDSQMGILLLGVFLDGAAVGPYKVAMQGAALVALGYTATNTPLTPQIARAWAEGNREKVRRLVKRGSSFAVLFALPIAIAFLLAGRPLVHLVFGADFDDAVMPLIILTMGQLVNCAFGGATALLIMTGHERYNTIAFAVALGFNVVAALILIPAMGVVGAALAAAMSVTLRNLLLWWCARRATGIDTGFWARLKP
ncbi:flippase [Croceicoccus mobilis]|uniref:Membrane protein n=1 Tax=Croceicoccus mobilis TaxID=1703339 RepID=A0A917DQ94_9SPHN|nr:flippase [Croceicoccus mobilis]GGD59743.1 membrane protein [Croceicoccus mobilis]